MKVGRALPLASGSQLDGQAQETAGDDDGFGLPRIDGKVRLSHVLIQEEISGILLLERLTHVSWRRPTEAANKFSSQVYR